MTDQHLYEELQLLPDKNLLDLARNPSAIGRSLAVETLIRRASLSTKHPDIHAEVQRRRDFEKVATQYYAEQNGRVSTLAQLLSASDQAHTSSIAHLHGRIALLERSLFRKVVDGLKSFVQRLLPKGKQDKH